jgi:hypothetical protein
VDPRVRVRRRILVGLLALALLVPQCCCCVIPLGRGDSGAMEPTPTRGAIPAPLQPSPEPRLLMT